MSEDTLESPFAGEENSHDQKNIVRGLEILPYLQQLEESHNPSEQAISIKLPSAFSDFDHMYETDSEKEFELRFQINDDQSMSVTEYFFDSENGKKKLMKIIRKTTEIDDEFETSEEVMEPDEEELERYFSQYTIQKTPSGDFILYGGDEFSNLTDEQFGVIAAEIDGLHKDVQKEIGLRGRPQIFLYRDEESIENHEIFGSRNYIDSNITADNEIVVQLMRTYTEDYDLVSDTRNRTVLAPVFKKLNSRIEGYTKLSSMGAPSFILDSEIEMLESTLREVSNRSDMKLMEAIFDEKIPTFKELEAAGFNIKKFASFRRVLEKVEMPFVFREGMARFVGAKISGASFDGAMKDAIIALGGYSSEMENYYVDILTDEYAKRVMPAFLWHISKHFGLSSQDIARAVSKTSNKDYSLQALFSALDIDSKEAEESWKSEMKRNLPR